MRKPPELGDETEPDAGPLPAEVGPAPVADMALDQWADEKRMSLGRRLEALEAFVRECRVLGIGRETAARFDVLFDGFLKRPA